MPRLRPSVTAKRALSAGFVFVGYGLEDARYGFDDYRGLDVRGKIVVALSGTPAGLPSDIAAHLNAQQGRDRRGAPGAIGFVEVARDNDGRAMADPVRRGGRPLIDWVDAVGQGRLGPPGLQLQLRLSQRLGRAPVRGRAQSRSPRVRRKPRRTSRAGPRGFALSPTLAVEADKQVGGLHQPRSDRACSRDPIPRFAPNMSC